MSSTYYADDDGWAYYIDGNGQSQYLCDETGNFVRYAEVAPSASESDSGKSDSGKSDSGKSDSGKSDSGKSDGSKSDSGQSSNTPATIGWKCHWCDTVNYTDHLMIPWMEALKDQNGNLLRDAVGNIVFAEYPYIPCGGCDGHCTPFATTLVDPQ